MLQENAALACLAAEASLERAFMRETLGEILNERGLFGFV